MKKENLIAAVLFCTVACSSSSESLEVNFTMTPDESNPNFVLLEASPIIAGAAYQWDITGVQFFGATTMAYIDRKGIHQVKLTVSDSSRMGTAVKKLIVAHNSTAFDAGERLFWSDEFLDRPIDIRKWNFDQGTNKWGNHELQNYVNKEDNAFIRDGKLVIRAIKTGAAQNVGDFTSARLNTKGKLEINRGRVEVRARLAGGRGMWPAIWMYGTAAQPYYTELDIVEYVGCDKNIVYGTIWNSDALANAEHKITSSRKLTGVEDEFHIYGMDWNDDGISFYIDTPSNVYLDFKPTDKSDKKVWPFDNPLYLILNVAVGGDWGGMRGVDDSVFPSEMEVDYVRIFQKRNP